MKTVNKQLKENLLWIDTLTGETFHAGVAFLVEEFGEYRLVLDSPRTVLYLKPVRSEDRTIFYSIYAVIETNGKFSHRVEVGNGYSSDETDHHIYMKLGRHLNQRLVLIPKGKNNHV